MTALYATSPQGCRRRPKSSPSHIDELRPDVIVNLTAFSGQGADGAASVLDRADAAVLQAILGQAGEEAWLRQPTAASARPISP